MELLPNPVQVYFFSSTGITGRIAKIFDGADISDYRSGKFVLLAPSYGAPRTGNHVPRPVKEFLAKHGHNMVGVIGVGNATFGSEFCLGAIKIAQRFDVPLVEKIDVVPTQPQIDKISEFLEGISS